jgi:glyoxylase-like metal-dependent hydrolase (beta-lactamase superfamily II)
MRNLLAVVTLLLCGCTSAIEDGLAMNGIVTVGDSFTSSFLLTTDDGALLFDVGITASGQPVIDALAEVGLSASDVTDVFLSHGHGDHVGGLAAFENARVRGIAEEQAVLDEEEVDVTIDAPVVGGEFVQVAGQTIEVFHVPGHTVGSAVYLVNGVLLLGDSAVATPSGRLEQPPERFSDDVEELDESLLALRDLLRPRSGDVAWMAYSHSGPTRGAGALMAYAGRESGLTQ